MKAFISWSGAPSQKLAQALGDWLTLVIQSVDPFVSTEIPAGKGWADVRARAAMLSEPSRKVMLRLVKKRAQQRWKEYVSRLPETRVFVAFETDAVEEQIRELTNKDVTPADLVAKVFPNG